jgi:putative transposase
MARLRRLAFAGQPHLVQQLGHRARPVFVDEDDRRSFLEALGEVVRQEQVALHGYALCDNEVRLLATPSTDDGLSRTMQALGRRHGARYNRRHGHVGSLWAGRFRACAAEPDVWALRCLRWIEQADSKSSSAAHHLGRHRDALVSELPAYWALGNTPFEREAAWAKLLEHVLTASEMAEIESASRRGWPLGGERYKHLLALARGRPVAPQRVGRPLKIAVPK